MTAPVVTRPKAPSTGPDAKPAALSVACRHRTASPRDPGRRTVAIAHSPAAGPPRLGGETGVVAGAVGRPQMPVAPARSVVEIEHAALTGGAGLVIAAPSVATASASTTAKRRLADAAAEMAGITIPS